MRIDQSAAHRTAMAVAIFALAVAGSAPLAVAAEAGTAAGPSAGPLDGKTFVGQVGERGKTTGDQDTLIFRDGTFRSTACDPYGFSEAAYTATPGADAITFQTETESQTDGRMEWRGRVQGSTIEGTSTWRRPGKAPVEYWFKGELQQQG